MEDIIKSVMERILVSEELFFNNGRQFSEKLTSDHLSEICSSEIRKLKREDLIEVLSSDEANNYCEIFFEEHETLYPLFGALRSIKRKRVYRRYRRYCAANKNYNLSRKRESSLAKILLNVFNDIEESMSDDKIKSVVAASIIREISNESENYVEFSKFFVFNSKEAIRDLTHRPRSREIDLVLPSIALGDTKKIVEKMFSDEDIRQSFLRSRSLLHIIANSPEIIADSLEEYKDEDDECKKEFFLARSAIIEKSIYDGSYSFSFFKEYIVDILKEEDIVGVLDMSDILSPMMISAMSQAQCLSIINIIEDNDEDLTADTKYISSCLIGELSTNISKAQQIFIAPILLKHNLEDILYGI